MLFLELGILLHCPGWSRLLNLRALACWVVGNAGVPRRTISFLSESLGLICMCSTCWLSMCQLTDFQIATSFSFCECFLCICPGIAPVRKTCTHTVLLVYHYSETSSAPEPTVCPLSSGPLGPLLLGLLPCLQGGTDPDFPPCLTAMLLLATWRDFLLALQSVKAIHMPVWEPCAPLA